MTKPYIIVCRTDELAIKPFEIRKAVLESGKHHDERDGTFSGSFLVGDFVGATETLREAYECVQCLWKREKDDEDIDVPKEALEAIKAIVKSLEKMQELRKNM